MGNCLQRKGEIGCKERISLSPTMSSKGVISDPLKPASKGERVNPLLHNVEQCYTEKGSVCTHYETMN